MNTTTATALTYAEAQRIVREASERLFVKIDFAEGGCWEWAASKCGSGYGRLRWQGRHNGAHRVVYELLVAPISDGLTIDHLCGNPGCVNPAHMEPVTLRENILRGRGVGVVNAAKTHCKHGHEFTPDNTYHYFHKQRGRPARACKVCRDEATRKSRKRADQLAESMAEVLTREGE